MGVGPCSINCHRLLIYQLFLTTKSKVNNQYDLIHIILANYRSHCHFSNRAQQAIQRSLLTWRLQWCTLVRSIMYMTHSWHEVQDSLIPLRYTNLHMPAAGENRALATRLMANMVVYNKPLALAVTDALLNVSTTASMSGNNPNNAIVEATKALATVLRATGLIFGAMVLTWPCYS